jgi:hypothetical protein
MNYRTTKPCGIGGRMRAYIKEVMGRTPEEEAEKRYRAKLAKENLRIYYRNRKALEQGKVL